MIEEKGKELEREDITDDEMLALMQRLVQMNRAKVLLAREMQRPIV